MNEPFHKGRDLSKIEDFRAEAAELAALATQQREAFATRSGSGGHPNPEFMFSRFEALLKAALAHVPAVEVPQEPPVAPKAAEKPPEKPTQQLKK